MSGGSTSSSDAGGDGNPDTEPLDLAAILRPMSVDRFTNEFWGRKPYNTVLGEEVQEQVLGRFCGGQLVDVLAECRRDDNSRFSSEEISAMEADLEVHRKTLNVPLCYCPGALDLQSSFIERVGLGNDVEVGVYFSKVGGDVAGWHFDNNHNITIQVSGQKDWYLAPGEANPVSNRGLEQAPRNWHEQVCPMPPPGRPSGSQHMCYNLRPGSVMYIPPGHWHSVVPVQEDSFSIDMRVANVAQCKWIAEAAFGGLLAQFYRDNDRYLGVGAPDWDGALSPGTQEQVQYLAKNISGMLQRCRLPRCIPFQRAHSDGLNKGASLQYLSAAGFLSPPLDVQAVLGVNPLVTLGLKRRDNRQLLLQMHSVSSLSASEYLRFCLVCPQNLYGLLAHLTGHAGPHALPTLESKCPPPTAGLVQPLLRVLVHCNVLHCAPDPRPVPATTPRGPAPPAEPPGQRPAKRRRKGGRPGPE